MGYTTKINTNQQNVSDKTVENLLAKLGADITIGPLSTYSGHDSPVKFHTNKHNFTFTLGGQTFTVKNTAANKLQYNVYDVVAAARAAGIPAADIATALNDTGITDYYDNGDARKWTADSITQYNQNTTRGTGRLQEYINKYYPQSNAQVVVTLKENGSGYDAHVLYTDPTTGAPVRVALPDFNPNDATLTDEAIGAFLGPQTNIGNSLSNVPAVGNMLTNANSQMELADAINKALKGNVGANANASRDLSAEDRAAVQAELPGTDNLKAWNQSKDANIFNTIIKNIQDSNPELLERASLKDLQGLAGIVSDEQVDTTRRNINTQKAQTVQGIAKDSALYQAIVNQRRADSAAGTIAGQRAANALGAAQEADASYDTAASDLYSKLFGGEQSVAQGAYTNVFNNQTGSLDQYINSMLNNASEAARQGEITSKDLNTVLTALAEATGVDVETFKNAVAERQAAAEGKATDIRSNLGASLKTDIAANDAALDKVKGLYNEGSSYLNDGERGQADVSAATDVITKALGQSGKSSGGGGYKTVTAGDYEDAKQFTNKQYNDVVNNPDFQKFLADDTIDALTKAKTIDDIKKQFGLITDDGIDILSEAGLNALYTQYSGEATKQANRVFNEAQRAYIAAITAGDAKTADQLTRLASSAGATKGNLYAASALTQQFKQQSGLGNTGRQLSTDFVNQRSFNRQAPANAALAANSALTKYVGNGSDNYDQATLYGVLNGFNQNAANNRNYYGAFGGSVMNSTQGINNSVVSNNINNYDRLSKLAGDFTTANATAGANNITNKSTKDIYKTYADAMKAQGQSTLDKLNKK